MVLGVDGNDSLRGDRAQDTLAGGLGNDLFVLRQSAGTTDIAFADAIADFQVGFYAIAELTFLQSYSTCNPHSADVGRIFLSVVKTWKRNAFGRKLSSFSITEACQIYLN